MVFLPSAGNKLIRFCHCRIGVDSAKDFVESYPMFHCRDIFGYKVSRVADHNSCSQDVVFSWCGQHFYNSLFLAVSNSSIKIIYLISSDFVRDALFDSFLFVKSDSCDFWVSERAPGYSAIVDFKFFKRAE